MKSLQRALVVASLAVCSSHAGASFIGSTAHCATTVTTLTPFTCDAPTSIVTSPGPEFRLLWGTSNQVWTVNIEDHSLRLSRLGGLFGWGGSPVLLDITGLDLSGLAVDSVNYADVQNFDLGGAVSVTGNDIRIDLNSRVDTMFSTVWSSGAYLDIQFSESGQVPEPGTLALLGAAVLAGGLSRRRGFRGVERFA